MLQEVLWNLDKRGALPHPEFVDGRADERRVPPAAAPHRQVCKFASLESFPSFSKPLFDPLWGFRSTDKPTSGVFHSQPCNHPFIQARDAIVDADGALTWGAQPV
jgi:hypothetical protein